MAASATLAELTEGGLRTGAGSSEMAWFGTAFSSVRRDVQGLPAGCGKGPFRLTCGGLFSKLHDVLTRRRAELSKAWSKVRSALVRLPEQGA
jgi:hypothetical protein